MSAQKNKPVYVTQPLLPPLEDFLPYLETIWNNKILTNGGPQDSTHVFATYAFQVGIQSGDIPLGATVSLFMFPLLAVFAILTLRGVNKRTKEMN